MLAVKANEELDVMPQQVVVQPDTYILVYEHRTDALVHIDKSHPVLKVPRLIRHVWVCSSDDQQWWKKILAQDCFDTTLPHVMSLNRSLFTTAGTEGTVSSIYEVLSILDHWLELYPEAHLDQLDLEAGVLYMAELLM